MKNRNIALLAVFGILIFVLVFFLDKRAGEAERASQFLSSSANSFLKTYSSIHNGYEDYIWKGITMDIFAINTEGSPWRYYDGDTDLPNALTGHTKDGNPIMISLTKRSKGNRQL